jgi:FO synthase
MLEAAEVPRVRRALKRAERGVSLDADEAEALLHARGDQLDALLQAAGRQRDAGLAAAGRSGVVTYSRKVFIPLTRLCRDRCHYCTFVTTPGELRRAGHAMFMTPDEVLDVARRGAAAGCREALFTLGDRPEERWPAAREWLESHGYDTTLDYVRAMSIRVLEETGLLPHLNPGVMSWDELARLKPVAASMGMMLETTSTRLFTEPGGAHFGSPDKDPAVRLRVLEDAGRQSIPFTTGILVGIGETLAERVDSLFAIRRVARAYGHVQEVIVQNFRAKPDTAMRRAPDADSDDYLATVAVARLVLGPKVRIQVPPNLSAPSSLARLLAAGTDDWGGVSPVTPDHVNPERPWPHLDDLARWSDEAGFTLTERLAVQPEYVRRGEPWIAARVRAHVTALAGPDGLADASVQPTGLPWQDPDGGYATFALHAAGGRTDLFAAVDTDGRHGDRRGDFDEVYGDWASVADDAARTSSSAVRLDGDVLAGLALAADDPAALARPEHESLALALFHAEGAGLAALARVADDVRRNTVGDDVSYVVNRNINFTNVCYVGCRFCAFAQRRTDADAYTLSLEQVGDRVAEAWDIGATEVCIQGGIHPDLPGTAYFELAREVKRRSPQMHLHAFSPMEVTNGATKAGVSVREWLVEAKAAGLDTIPGTAAEILDDDVRWVLTKGKLPTSAWIDVVTTAHSLGIRSSSTMMYGHVDTPVHWYRHLVLLRGIQERTGGFTEFVPLPFVHHNAPVYLAGVARPGPTRRDNVAVHAMARLLLHGAIDHVQTSWVKLDDDGVGAMLASGVDDLGGTLMEETISRMAGSENGSFKTVGELDALIRAAGRTPRQRTTTYGDVSAERIAAAARSGGRLPDRAGRV